MSPCQFAILILELSSSNLNSFSARCRCWRGLRADCLVFHFSLGPIGDVRLDILSILLPDDGFPGSFTSNTTRGERSKLIGVEMCP